MVDAIFMHLNASAPEMSESKTMQNIATSVVERFLCRVPKALRIHTYVIGNTTLCMYRLLIKGWNSICFISVIPTALSKLECTVLSSQWNITKESGLSSFASLFSTGLLLFLPFMDASVASIQLPEEKKQCYYLTQVAYRALYFLLAFLPCFSCLGHTIWLMHSGPSIWKESEAFLQD